MGQAIVPGWQGYRKRGEKEGKAKEEREEGQKIDEREKEGKLKAGNDMHDMACAKTGPDHATVIRSAWVILQ